MKVNNLGLKVMELNVYGDLNKLTMSRYNQCVVIFQAMVEVLKDCPNKTWALGKWYEFKNSLYQYNFDNIEGDWKMLLSKIEDETSEILNVLYKNNP